MSAWLLLCVCVCVYACIYLCSFPFRIFPTVSLLCGEGHPRHAVFSVDFVSCYFCTYCHCSMSHQKTGVCDYTIGAFHDINIISSGSSSNPSRFYDISPIFWRSLPLSGKTGVLVSCLQMLLNWENFHINTVDMMEVKTCAYSASELKL